MYRLTRRSLGATVGVELRGVDLARHDADDALIGQVDDAAAEFGLVLLPGQMLTDEQQLAFTRRFGPVDVMPGNRHRDKSAPAGVAEISNVGADGELLPPEHGSQRFSDGNRQWHADLSFTARGSTYSMLCAREVPATGGETEFADTAAAYDALSDDMKRRIDGLEAEHNALYSRRRVGYDDFSPDELEQFASARHPLVLPHPVTGRKALFMGSHAERIVGMDYEEGQVLLAALLTHATEARFVYVHRWAVGDLIIWDNRRMLHRRGASFDPSERRDMRRTTVVGDLDRLQT